jgi:peptidoglycan hydrolase-like protein with peptidoglycan-binding domain
MRGIDYAWSNPKPNMSTLKSLGVGFIARYLSPDPSKNLTVAEKNAAVAAGLAVVVVWESSANRALSGFAAGVADAQAADAQVKALGMTGDPIHFAADFDASAAQQAAINAYLDGAASVIGKARVGLYAGFYPLSRAFNAGKITYGWQTYAWSGGQWDARAQLRQVQNGVTVAGQSADWDESMAADFGQWPRHATALTFPLKQGMIDPAPNGLVWQLQGNLVKWAAALGIPVTQVTKDGNYGPVTAGAVALAQAFFGERGVAAGVCTQATFTKLAGPVIITPPPKPPAVPPPAPTGLKGVSVSTAARVTLSWAAVKGVTSYEVQLEYYKPKFGWVLSVTETVSATSLPLAVAPASKFRFRVSSGTWSGWTEFTTA